MDVLILGGTGFLGRHLVEAALGSGHRVTLFNRGIKAPELPLWVPREDAALLDVDCGKAIEAGLTFRSLSETIEDVLEWDRARPVDTELAAGLTPEREQELLRAWRGVTL
jgi:uncharacterized protein YbjT (DUF2867 family)